VPMTAGFELRPPPIGADARFQLSRFAYCHRDGQALVLESPLSLARVILPGHAGAALVAELAQPRTCRDLTARVGEVAEDTAQTFLSLLVNAAVVAEVSADGALPEDAHPPLVQWEFHDLLFHARSRPGRHDSPVGTTYRFLGQIPPLPALKPPTSDAAIPLYRPNLEAIEREEPFFTSVLERRTSIRQFGEPPITVQQLGEFLYRVGRVRAILDPDPSRGCLYEASNRPYPSGGATYDLELYLTVNTCEGLAAGIYYYNPLEHQLHRVAERTAQVEALLRGAQADAELSSLPQLLITMASRFQRLSWKYSGMAYATTLKNVGVLYQTMYLVATAMGLAPCALAVSNSALFAEAVGTDYFAESAVGEFLLGSAG
jgi:oxazoline/thiazoline dehydrogenase